MEMIYLTNFYKDKWNVLDDKYNYNVKLKIMRILIMFYYTF